jgi:hypothetical protein
MAKKNKERGSVLNSGTFPNPFATPEEKQLDSYGLMFARGIESQWELTEAQNTFFRNRIAEFEEARDYAYGRQNTQIYKTILSALDNNDNDGSLLSLDWRPVPILPKFRNIVINKVLSRNIRPNLEAVDPVSLTEKDDMKAELRALVRAKEMLVEAEKMGLEVPVDTSTIPETTEETEIYIETSVKTSAEIAAQLAVQLTYEWNDFNETTLRRCVEDLVDCGMCVIKRENDPNYGIIQKYVNPSHFVHAYTEDKNFSDINYAGHVERITVEEANRIAKGHGRELDKEQLLSIGSYYNQRNNNDFRRRIDNDIYDQMSHFVVDIVFFEFITTEKVWFEEKQDKYGNKKVYKKGTTYKQPTNSVFERKPHCMEVEVVYKGAKIVGTDTLLYYEKCSNMPRSLYDIKRTKMSYVPMAVNFREMQPTSLITKVRGFADMLQITHLKMQQAIAKAKADGLSIDIEGLENVDLGTGGSLDPLDLHDIYEKTSVFYYRSKTIDGQRTGNPIMPIPQPIRQIQDLSNAYNFYLNLIRDATGINDVMDGSSPKGEQLVGVREQAMEMGNNAIYDVTHTTHLLFKKVTEDCVKCLQILPSDSVLFKIYENAIGKTNMKVLNSFKKIPMINIGVNVIMDMDDIQKSYLEQNIQVSLAAKELDIEDAIAIRNLEDIDQAEQLLIIRRKKRIKQNQEIAAQNSQMQSQMNVQTAQAKSQGDMQLEQMRSELEMQKEQMKHELLMQQLEFEWQKKLELARIESDGKITQKEYDHINRSELENKREEAKDVRVKKQAALQSKMIEQRKGTGGVIEDDTEQGFELQDLIGQ